MTVNPVTMRELRERFRRNRAGLFVTIWIVVVTGVGYLIYLAARSWASSAGMWGISPMLISTSLGRIMFQMVSLLLLSAMLLVVPGVASLSIVGERERLTLPLLQVSQLSPRQIVLGKLASSLAYQMLLLVAVAPVLLVPMLFGGVGIGDVVAALAVIGATAILVGSLSVWISARAKSTRGAVAGSYLIAFALTAGTGLLLIGEVVFFAPSDHDTWGANGRELYSLWLNPYAAMVSAVDEPLEATNEFVAIGTPFDPFDTLLSYRQWGSGGGMFIEDMAVAVADTGVSLPMDFAAPGDNQVRLNRGRLWVRSLLVAALLTVLVLWQAARRITVPAPARLRLRRRKEPEHAPA